MRYGLLLLMTLLALLVACSNRQEEFAQAERITGGGNADAGAERIRYYGCITCHTIPGIAGADGLVGPPLTNIASRLSIAGELPNTPPNLMIWIQHPRQVEPETLMPEMGVTANDSRDIAAYLYTLR